MPAVEESLIHVLKVVALNDSLEAWKKRDQFNAQVTLLENDQESFVRWIELFISNHKEWLVESDYYDHKVNCFDSVFEDCLDKLEEEAFYKLLLFAENYLLKEQENNIPISILFLEGVRFGYKIPSQKELESQSSHLRQYNAEVNQVHEIHFPCKYSHVEKNFDRMTYCNCNEEPTDLTHRFGGVVHGLEEAGINRIITIDPLPDALKIRSVSRLTIAFNFDKAFWLPINLDSPYFIKHNNEGEPVKELTTIKTSDIEFYKENPLVECQVMIKQTPSKYIHHHNSKNEWRIGGEPNWVQNPEVVCCIECNEAMKFVVQLPSGYLKDSSGEGVYYGSDGGTTFGFWCDKDLVMAYIWQDT